MAHHCQLSLPKKRNITISQHLHYLLNQLSFMRVFLPKAMFKPCIDKCMKLSVFSSTKLTECNTIILSMFAPPKHSYIHPLVTVNLNFNYLSHFIRQGRWGGIFSLPPQLLCDDSFIPIRGKGKIN